LERRAVFWKSVLAGRPRLWDSLEGSRTASGAHQRMLRYIPPDLANATQELARISGTTLFNTLLTAFQISLARWLGQKDILVGTPVTNRTRKAVRETMGYCAGIVPLRRQLDEDRSFSESVREMHQATGNFFANAMPFAELVAALGDRAAPGHHPVFEIRFALQNHPVPEVSLHGVSARLKMLSTGTARFQIGCEITVIHDEFELAWLFRPSLFPQTEIENLARIFKTVLEFVCSSPNARIANITT
jgi:non-ribosomal peptide synthetase component F